MATRSEDRQGRGGAREGSGAPAPLPLPGEEGTALPPCGAPLGHLPGDGETRAFRVERIRESLERGLYRVDGAAVAGRMVDDAVEALRLRGPSALRGELLLEGLLERVSAEFRWGAAPRRDGQAK